MGQLVVAGCRAVAAAALCAPARPAAQAARGRVRGSAFMGVYASLGESVAGGLVSAMGGFGFGAARLLAVPGGSVAIAAAAALVLMPVGLLLACALWPSGVFDRRSDGLEFVAARAQRPSVWF